MRVRWPLNRAETLAVAALMVTALGAIPNWVNLLQSRGYDAAWLIPALQWVQRARWVIVALVACAVVAVLVWKFRRHLISAIVLSPRSREMSNDRESPGAGQQEEAPSPPSQPLPRAPGNDEKGAARADRRAALRTGFADTAISLWNNAGVFLTLGYAYLTAIGILYLRTLFAQFGIDILDYAHPADLLVASMKRPGILMWALIFAAAVVLYVTLARVWWTPPFRDDPHLFARHKRTIVFCLVLAVLMFVWFSTGSAVLQGLYDASRIQKGAAPLVVVRFDSSDETPLSLSEEASLSPDWSHSVVRLLLRCWSWVNAYRSHMPPRSPAAFAPAPRIWLFLSYHGTISLVILSSGPTSCGGQQSAATCYADQRRHRVRVVPSGIPRRPIRPGSETART